MRSIPPTMGAKAGRRAARRRRRVEVSAANKNSRTWCAGEVRSAHKTPKALKQQVAASKSSPDLLVESAQERSGPALCSNPQMKGKSSTYTTPASKALRSASQGCTMLTATGSAHQGIKSDKTSSLEQRELIRQTAEKVAADSERSAALERDAAAMPYMAAGTPLAATKSPRRRRGMLSTDVRHNLPKPESILLALRTDALLLRFCTTPKSRRKSRPEVQASLSMRHEYQNRLRSVCF